MTGLTSHPCVLVSQEQLHRLRAIAADRARNAFGFSTGEAWEELRARADEFVAAGPYHYRVEIAPRRGQPREVWEYTLSDATPPRHDRTSAYPPWTAMFQERPDSISTRLKYLGLAFLVTGEEHYFERARRIAMHLCKWDYWTDPSYGGGRIKACLDTGHAAQNVGLFYDWCFERLSDDERAEVRASLIGKGIKPILADLDRYAANTNGYAVLTCGLGLASLAIRGEEPRGAEWVRTAIDRTRQSLDLHGRDGGAYEGPMYGTYLLDSFATFFDALESARVQHGLFEHPFLATMDRYCISLLYLGNRTQPCFGDGRPKAGYRQIMSILAHRGSEAAAWYLQQIGALRIDSVNELLRFDAGKLHPRQPQWNPSEVFVDIGYAILRDGYNADAPFLALKCGPPKENIGHNHYDHNAFVIAHRGEWVVPDRGYRSRTHPPSTKFQQGTAGHCSILIDVDDDYLRRTQVPELGHEQVLKAGGEIVEFFRSSSLDVVKGRAAKVYNTAERTVLDRFDRTILYLKPHCFVIHDELASPEPHRFSFLLHSDNAGVIEPQGDGWLLRRRRAQLVAHVFSPTLLTQRVRHWPEAEHFGPFLQAETEATRAAGLTTVLVPQAHVNPNLILNTGFEHGLHGWRPRTIGLDNHGVDRETTSAGETSGRIERNGYFYSMPFHLPAGTRIVGKAMVKTANTTERGASLRFHFWKGGKSFHPICSETVRPEDWTELSVEGMVPEGAEEMCLGLYYQGDGVGWFDAVSIECDPPVEVTAAEAAPPVNVEALDEGQVGAVVTLGHRRYLVLINSSGSPKRVVARGHTYETDGRLACLGFDEKRRLESLALYEGTRLAEDGETLLSVDRCSAIAARLERGRLNATVQHDLAPHSAIAPSHLVIAARLPADSARVNGHDANIRTDAGLSIVTLHE